METEQKTPEQVAELLHDAMCGWNHTDGCDWFYGTWENNKPLAYSRNQYLCIATRLIATLGGNVNLAFKVAEALKK